MTDSGNQSDFELPASITDATGCLRRVALIHGVWTVVIALLAGLLLALTAFGVALSLAAAGVSPRLLSALFPVFLSVAGAVLALWMVIFPLTRTRGAAGHAIRLEEVSGVTGDLLSAVELHRAASARASLPLLDRSCSPELLGEVGRRAGVLLQRIPTGVRYPLRRVVLLVYGVLGVASLLLVVATLRPDAAKDALAAVLQADEDQRFRDPAAVVEVSATPERVGSGADATRRRGSGRPCEDLEAAIIEPSYAGGRSRAIPVNGRFSVLAGSRLRVTCSAPFPDACIELDTRRDGVRTSVPLALQPRRDRDLVYAAEVSLDEPHEIRLLRRLDDLAGNIWHHGVWVFEILEDAPPSCWLLEPASDVAADRGHSLSVSVEARDDWGIRRVLLKYRVLEFDAEERSIELAVVDDRLDVRIDDPVAVAAFGAEGGQHVVLCVEVEDARPGAEPGRCRTRPITLTVHSAAEEYRAMVVRAAELRDRTIDLLGDLVTLHRGEGLRRTIDVVMTFDRLAGLVRVLAEQTRGLAESAMVEQDIVRRFAEMEARLSAISEEAEGCWEHRAARLHDCAALRLSTLRPELERDVLVLADVVDGLLNSYLVHWSQELEQQRRSLAHLLTRTERAGLREVEILRAASRLRVKLDQVTELSGLVRPHLPPALFAGTAVGGRSETAGWVARAVKDLEALTAGLGNGEAATAALLDDLGRAVDELNRSIEGEYARVLTRTTEGFQKRVVQLKLEILEAKSLCRDMLGDLKDFLVAWEKRRESHLKPRLKRRWKEIRRQIRELRKVAARLDETTYLPLERQGVSELRTELGRLRASLSKARMEDASGILEQVQERLQAMVYSLELVQRYGGPEAQGRKVRKERARIESMVEAAARLEAEIRQVMPVKKRLLRPGDLVRLDRLVEMGDAIRGRLRVAEEKLGAMEAAFPALHGRVDVLLSQARRAVDDAQRSLQALDVEGAGTMVDYAMGSLSGAVVVLDEATRPARRGAMVVASGGAGGGAVELGPRGEADFPRLVRMAEEAADTDLPLPWKTVVDDYFRRLLR